MSIYLICWSELAKIRRCFNVKRRCAEYLLNDVVSRRSVNDVIMPMLGLFQPKLGLRSNLLRQRAISRVHRVSKGVAADYRGQHSTSFNQVSNSIAAIG